MIPAGTIIQRQNRGRMVRGWGGGRRMEGHEKSEEPFGAASSSLLERITGEEAACVRKENFFLSEIAARRQHRAQTESRR